MPRDLTAELRTDGPAAACHEDDLAVDEVIDLMKVGGNGLAPQKVLDGDVLELRDGDLAGDKLVHAGEHLDFAAGLVADAEDLFPVLARHAGHGEEDLRDLVLLDILENGLASSHDGDALDGAVPLVGVVVDDADSAVIHLVRGLEVTKDHSSGFAGANDHDTAAGSALAHHVGTQEEEEAEEEAQAYDKEQLEHGAPDVVGQGHAGIQHSDEDAVEHRRGQRAEDGADQLLEARKAPHDAVHVEKVEDHHREDGIPGDEGEIGIQEARLDGGIVAVEAEPEGQEVGDMDHGEVVDHGEKGNDLPMLDVFELLHMASPFLRRIKYYIPVSCEETVKD